MDLRGRVTSFSNSMGFALFVIACARRHCGSLSYRGEADPACALKRVYQSEQGVFAYLRICNDGGCPRLMHYSGMLASSTCRLIVVLKLLVSSVDLRYW